MQLSNVLRQTPYFKGKARLLHTLCPRGREVEAELFGSRVRLDLSNYIERSAYLGVFEPEETRLIASFLKPGMVVFDVGANIGYYTLLTSPLVGPTGSVYAFEPSSYAFNKLTRAVKENRLTNVRTFKLALGAQEGELELSPCIEGNHTPNLLEGGGEKIHVTTLDSFVREHSIQRIDFLKMDVEGFEPFVVEGGRNSFSSGLVRAVLCEFSATWLERSGHAPKRMYQDFLSMGFRPATPFYPDVPILNVLFMR